MATNKTISQLDLASDNFRADEWIPIEDENLATNGKINRLDCIPFIKFNYPPNYLSNNPPVASGVDSIAIGMNGLDASADGAIQIGTGVNSEVNTLQFLSNNFANQDTIKFKSIQGIPTDVLPDGSVEIDPIGSNIYGRIGGVWENVAKKENFIVYNPVNHTALPIGYNQGSVTIGGGVVANNTATGVEHLAIGSQITTSAVAYCSIIGSNSGLNSTHGTMIGSDLVSASSLGSYSLIVGTSYTIPANSPECTLIGSDISRTGGANNVVSIGKSTATGANVNTQVLIGNNTVSNSLRTVTVGNSASTTGNDSVAIGANTVTNGTNASATGFNASCTANSATTIGANSVNSSIDSTSVGKNIVINGSRSTCLGKNASTTSLATDSVQIGDGTCITPNSVQYKNRVICGRHGFVAQTVSPGSNALNGQLYVTSTQICVWENGNTWCANIT